MALFSKFEKNGSRYEVKLSNRVIEIKDDLAYLEYFANKNPLKNFLEDQAVWGEDLTAYADFYETVESNIEKIMKGESLI